MKKLIFILLFPISVFGQVPNNTTFTLDTVVAVVAPSSNDLAECFNDAVKSYFNVLYDSIGYAPVRSMLRFRDYGDKNILYNDLIYYYKFNDSGTTISEVMQSYNMTVTGDSAKALSPGKLNTAYKFKSAEANTNKIYHSSAVTTANYDTLTLSYWLKVDTLPTFDVSIYSSITGTGVIGPLIRLTTGGRIDAGYKWSGGASTSSGVGGTVTVGAWHNITIVWWYNSSDGKQYVKGYKDGVFVSSGNGIVTPTTPLVSYGFEINIGPSGGIKSTFTIDDFKIWKRELNITEIGINYNGGIGVEF